MTRKKYLWCTAMLTMFAVAGAQAAEPAKPAEPATPAAASQPATPATPAAPAHAVVHKAKAGKAKARTGEKKEAKAQ